MGWRKWMYTVPLRARSIFLRSQIERELDCAFIWNGGSNRRALPAGHPRRHDTPPCGRWIALSNARRSVAICAI